MYNMSDRVADLLSAIVILGGFLWLWTVAARADLAIVGF